MAIWIVATVIAGFSSSRGNGDAVPYSLSCPMMSLNALGSNSDIPAKEYYFAVSRAVIIGNDVFIGGRSLILKGVNIGNNVVIGAGSVITRNVPSNTIIAGNPAKILKEKTAIS